MCKSLTNKIEKLIEGKESIREIAESYKELSLLKDFIETKMALLKPTLVEAQVKEFFDEEEMKVQYQEGRDKSFLDSNVVCKMLTLDEIIQTATFTQTSLEKIGKSEVISRAIVIEGKTAPSIKVVKMTKTELKERIAK